MSGKLGVSIEDVTRNVFDQLETKQPALMAAFRHIVELVVAEVLASLEEDGGCTFDWHRSLAEFDERGLCSYCGKGEAEHETKLMCPEDEDEEITET